MPIRGLPTEHGRLTSDVWIMAHVRRCNADDVPAMVVRRGDDRAGALILKLNMLNGTSRVLSQATGPDGNPGWLAAFDGEARPDAEADDYVARAVKRDPDIWVVEIEHRDGWHPFDGKVL
ncbi:MAG: DUF1491 family protein [Rhodospirillaceae bacterium]